MGIPGARIEPGHIDRAAHPGKIDTNRSPPWKIQRVNPPRHSITETCISREQVITGTHQMEGQRPQKQTSALHIFQEWLELAQAAPALLDEIIPEMKVEIT